MTLDDFSPEFRRYLEYMGKMPAEDATPEALNSVYAANSGRFEIWNKLPEALKERYKGSVPPDVMEAAARDEYLTLREMEYHPEIKNAEDARTKVEERYDIPADITSKVAKAAFIGAVVAGYSRAACAELALNSQIRENLADKARSNTLSEEEKKIWEQTRRDDFSIIKKDWTETAPEKLLIHVLSDFNRGKLKQEEVVPMIADLVQKIHNDGRSQQLLDYMKKAPIQAKLSHFKDEVLNVLEAGALPKITEVQQQQSLRTLASNIREQAEKRKIQQTNIPTEAIRQQLSGLQR